jgi:hypothetical protein
MFFLSESLLPTSIEHQQDSKILNSSKLLESIADVFLITSSSTQIISEASTALRCLCPLSLSKNSFGFQRTAIPIPETEHFLTNNAQL